MENSELADALRRYAAAGFSGVLRVHGRPGATIYLTDGRISACETPGAPGLEVILLRSRRVSADDWSAACAAAAAGGLSLTAQLIGRGLLGAGEAEALLRTTLADAMFALVSGQVDGWTEAPPAGCLLPLTPAARPGWLLAEAARRAQVLASLAEPTEPADERRAARDLAFTSGRGLYATMLQRARSGADGAAAP
jgi:hypothetical protein